jgi:hypothetical protein
MATQKPLLHVVHKEFLTPKKFLDRLAEQRSNIAHASVQAPKIGQKGYGRIVVRYKHPILAQLKPQHG